MEYKKLIQDAGTALKKAIDALLAGDPIEGNIGEARVWLEAAWLQNLSEDEKDEIHHLECLAFCVSNDYDGAYEVFQKANMGREVPPTWQEIGVIIYAKMSLPDDLAKGL